LHKVVLPLPEGPEKTNMSPGPSGKEGSAGMGGSKFEVEKQKHKHSSQFTPRNLSLYSRECNGESLAQPLSA
jgi:hypothetical protein